MKNTQISLFTTVAMALSVACALTACGGGTDSSTAAATPTTTATPTPTPAPSPTPSTPTATTRVSKNPSIYYFDDTGQWRLMPGVTSGQAMDAGVLCKGPADPAQAAAWIAGGKTQAWVDANIYTIILCPGY
jgi:hypothetical protein